MELEQKENKIELTAGIPLKKKNKTSIGALREKLLGLEQGGLGRRKVVPLGARALDRHLPGGGLPLAGLHEIEGARAEWDDGVASGFCVALLARLAVVTSSRPLAWVSRSGDLYGAGLATFGLDPAHLLQVRAACDQEVLWALEEALRCSSLAAVVGEVTCLDRTAGRRLQLAAEASGVTAFLLRRCKTPPRRTAPPSAALTRWRVAPAPSGPAVLPRLPGRPRWQLDLQRCRGAAPGRFLVEWDDASSCFAMAAALCDGSLDPDAKTGEADRSYRAVG